MILQLQVRPLPTASTRVQVFQKPKKKLANTTGPVMVDEWLARHWKIRIRTDSEAEVYYSMVPRFWFPRLPQLGIITAFVAMTFAMQDSL